MQCAEIYGIYKYVHSIIVDEENNLRAGYTTYLLAREEGGYTPEIMRVRKGQIFKKIIVGTYNGEEEEHTWYYEDGPAVCPGDVLEVPGGRQFTVDYVGYVAGKYDCERFETLRG